MKIGLDLHGIINTHPSFFSALTQSLKKDNHEIHILTGSHLKENKIEEELKNYGIAYTHIFSIADFHRENKTADMWYDTNGEPWISDLDWDKTKADYCEKNKIDFCIDDTARYANHFNTPFGYMAIQMHKDKPNKYLKMVINLFNQRKTKKTYKNFLQKVELKLEKRIGWFFSPKEKLGKTEKNSKYN